MISIISKCFISPDHTCFVCCLCPVNFYDFFPFSSLFYLQPEYFFRMGWIAIAGVLIPSSLASSEPPPTLNPWKSLFPSPSSKPPSPLSLPPSLVCPPSLDIPNLVKSYNSINQYSMILSRIQYSDLNTAIFTNSSEAISYITAPSLMEAEASCTKSGHLFSINSATWSYAQVSIENYVKNTKINLAIKLSLSSENKPVTNDNFPIDIPNQPFDSTKPYLIFTPSGTKFASSTTSTNSIICTNPNSVLNPKLQSVQQAIEAQSVSIDSKKTAIKEKIHTIVPSYSNYIVQFTLDQTANLILKHPNPHQTCILLQINLIEYINNFSFPSLITPSNLDSATELLLQRLEELHRAVDGALQTLDLLLQPNQTPPNTLDYSYQSYSDLFLLLPKSSPMRSLLLILLISLGSSTLIFVLLLVLLVYLMVRGNKILNRSNTPRVVNLALQGLPDSNLNPSAPLLRLQNVSA